MYRGQGALGYIDLFKSGDHTQFCVRMYIYIYIEVGIHRRCRHEMVRCHTDLMRPCEHLCHVPSESCMSWP